MRFTPGAFTYLDHLTVTPVLDEALAAFTETLANGYGNTRSSNLPGRKALEFCNRASEEVADFFGGKRTFFYSDGGMAAGLSVAAIGRAARKSGREHIVASSLEITPIVSVLRMLNSEGSEVTFLPSDGNGRISPCALRDAMTDRTGLVISAWGSAVSGVVQPVDELADISHEGGALFHSDATAVAGRLKIDLNSSKVDVITIDSHRLGGLPGTGAVVSSLDDPWVMSEASEYPAMSDIPGIAAFLAALRVINTGILPRARLVNQLRLELLDGLDRLGIGYSIVGGKLEFLLPGAALLRLNRIYAGFHARMEDLDVILPSHLCSERLSYLKSLGLDVSEEDQERYLGFSLAPMNTILEVEHFLRAVSMSISRKTGR